MKTFFYSAPGRGLLVWLVVMGLWWQPRPLEPTWILGLLFFSVLVLMPLSHRLLERERDPGRPWLGQLEVVCGFLLVLSFLRPPGVSALLMALPWFLYRGWWAWGAVAKLAGRRFQGSLADWTVISACVFPVIGAGWALANRINYAPMGFDALTVLLTAAHFHHAGFTLPLMAGLGARECPGIFSRVACFLILAGVPLVALGITGTHFKVLPWLEPMGVAVLVAGVLGVAVLQMRVALKKAKALPARARVLLGLSAFSLGVAMLLALGFGLRSILPDWALPLPQMWAVHGTLNTFGFGLGGLLGWLAWERRREVG